GRERELAVDSAELEALTVLVLGARIDERRVRAADAVAHGLDPLLGRELVAVADQVEIGVVVGRPARGRAGQEDRPRRRLLDDDVGDSVGQRAQVLGRRFVSGHGRRLGILTPTYESAGVSLAKAGDVVERLRAAVESTGARDFGGFAGLFPLDDTRLLAASTDSIGTKPMVARPRGKLRNCGADMAAHCINDVATTGADPLFLLDYVASERVDLEHVVELVEGAAEVCRAAGCALIGGETAEMPDVYRDGELDFAATCVGIVDREALVDGSAIEAGDVVIGFSSAGMHANGFTLVRRVLETEDYDGDDLLAPTRLYLDVARSLRGR